MTHYWLSFVDNDRPVGQRFLGATIMEASSGEAAIEKAWLLGINPGGEVAFAPFDEGAELPDQSWVNRLVGADELMGSGKCRRLTEGV